MTPLRAGLLCLCVLAVEWFAIASDYKDSVFLGTYDLTQGSESSTLTLRTDQTFQQEVLRTGATQIRRGTWKRVSEGEIAFSRSLLPLKGQAPGADGTEYGSLEKSLGLFPTIALGPQGGVVAGPSFAQPVFRKRVLSY